MAIPDKDRKARANYKKKIRMVRIELYGTDSDIEQHLDRIKADGLTVQGYIKSAIREKMANDSAE